MSRVSDNQSRLWFLVQLTGSSAFHHVCGLRLTGRVDRPALERGVATLVERHAVLRTGFTAAGGQPEAVSTNDVTLTVEETDDWRRWARDVFDLSRPPLFRTLLTPQGDGHLFVFCAHQLICDAKSLELLFQEWAELYRVFVEGGEASANERPGTSRHAEHPWEPPSDAAVLAEEIGWWRGELADAPPLLLAGDRQRPALTSFRGARHRVSLRGFGRQVEHDKLCDQALAAFVVLLSKWTGLSDVTLGTQEDGRSAPGTEAAVGPLANPLPVRVDLAGDPTFTEVVARTSAALQRGRDHAIPFARLVEALAPERDTSRQPLFQVRFLRRSPGRAPQPGGGLEASWQELDPETTEYDLTLELRDRDGTLADAFFEYSTDLFDPSTIARLAHAWRFLLETVLRAPEERLSELVVLDAAARHQQLREWADTTLAEARQTPVHRLFEQRFEGHADGDAVVFPAQGSSLTYRELNARANRLAHFLRGAGLRPDQPVAISLQRSLEMTVAVLGTLKAGGFCVPLDPAYPAERLRFMLADAKPDFVLTDTASQGRLPPTDARLVVLDADPPELAGMPDHGMPDHGMPEHDPSPASELDHLIYLIYTSGSTGRPKGVALPHRCFASLVPWHLDTHLGGVRTLQFASLSFDVSYYEMFTCWLSGGTLVLITEEQRRDVLALGRLLDAERVEKATFPVVVLEQLAQLVESGTIPMPRALREATSTGEQLRVSDTLRSFFERLPECRLHNHYGPSEAHVVTAHALPEVPERWPSHPPIGRAVDNTRIFIADSRLRPVAAGVPGELLIGGVHLARGYLGRPGLTAERFVPDPLSGLSGERLYRSGDQARLLADGTIEYQGRLDHQVKIRGYRIELAEIEAVLGEHPAVREAVVMARRDHGDVPRLVAYTVLAAGREDEGGAAELRAFLGDRLPDYMVPAAFVALDAFPLSPNRKVDLKALPAPEASAAAAYVAPRNPTEETLAGLWREVLGVEKVGAFDDFFALGGHSLLGTQLLSRIRQELDAELSPQVLFEHRTLAALAAYVEASADDLSSPKQNKTAIVAQQRAFPLPLSFAQQRLWFLDRLTPGLPLYNIPMALHLRGPLDAAALEAALAGIVRRHEALRTTFSEHDGRPRQVIHPFDAADRVLPAVEPEDASAWLDRESRQPFDLEQGPLFRCRLLCLGAEEHVLFVNVHHIVFDGWSIGVFLDELVTGYRELAAGGPAPSEPALQYVDFTLWQRRWLSGDVLEEQLAYWRRALDRFTPTALPTDRPRPAQRRHHGAVFRFPVGEELRDRLAAFGQEQGVTLYMTLMTAFQILVGRWTGQDDVVVGSPIANRNRREIESLLGFFVNTLVMRGDLSGAPDFLGSLRRTRQFALEAFAHQDLPFEKLVEVLEPSREVSRSPLVQMLFVLQNAPSEVRELAPDVRMAFENLETGTAKLDLIFFVEEKEGELRGQIEFDTDLFDRTTVRRLAKHYEALLRALVTNPRERVADVSLMDRAERWQVLGEWNDTRSSAGLAAAARIEVLFARAAAARPDAVALELGDERWTYGELDRRSTALSRRLRCLGVGPEVCVAVCAERSPETVAALLAILKAGGVFVPLDPAYPAERLAFMLDDVSAPVLVAHERLLGAIPLEGRHCEVVLLDDGAWEDVDGPSPEPASAGHPDNLAYVMYTSGSTGRPKGVGVPHRAVVRLVQEANFARLEDETFLLLAPISFDATTLEIWAPLLNGGRLAIAPPGLLGLRELGEVLERHAVTTLWLTAGLFHQMVAENPEGLRPVRQLLAGGDVLSAENVRRVLEELPGTTVINGYGPTENTTFTTCAPMRRPSDVAPSVSIGRPITGTRTHVLDAGLRPVPIGVTGQLYTGGLGLARGYFHRPERTAENFVPDPLAIEGGSRLYRTGDRARLLADGRLEFLGRDDNQVKLRGFRIELGEIEAALERHADLVKAVVMAREDDPGDRRLAAYVVPREGAVAPAVEALAEFLGDTLPSYMVPRDWVVLDTLPLNANGKVDRRALPVPERAGSTTWEGPRTEVERILASIWATVLRHDRISIHDDFFALGGHSLLATQALSRVTSALGVDLPLQTFFAKPTVAGIAAEVEALRRDSVALPPIRPRPPAAGAGAPLSFSQLRLWFLDRYEPGLALYNIPMELRLAGPLDRRALRAALSEVGRRHEVLRTTFAVHGDTPVQIVAPTAALPLPELDLAGLDDGGKEADAFARREAARPFDLLRGPLLRCHLLRLGPEEHRLLVNVHHVAFDGWSAGILLDELASLYPAFASGSADARLALAPLPIQYADFAVWQRTWLRDDVLESQLRYWREQLAGLADLELSTDRPRPARRKYRGDVLPFELPASLSGDLHGLGRRVGVTLFMTLLTGFQSLLHRWTGQSDFAVGSPIANRHHAEVEGLLGFFVNTLVLRAGLTGSSTFSTLLEKTRETALEGYTHQDLPFEKLVEELDPRRARNQTPLVQVIFAFQSGADGVRELAPGLELTFGYLDTATAKFDLTLSLDDPMDGGALRGWIEYDTDLFDATTVGQLAASFQVLLEAAAAAPERRVGDLPLLSAAAAAELLRDGAVVTTYPRERALPELFAEWVADRPDEPAMVCGDARITYGELNARANRLARYLVDLGVGPESLVGVAQERSMELVVTLLAIVKAGAAYMPLDLAYPRERLALMLEDSAAQVVVGTESALGQLPEHDVRTVCLEHDREMIDAGDAGDPPWRGGPLTAAYVLFTSGSTGRPKGVVVPQRAIVRLVRGTDYLDVEPGDRFAQVANPSFDAVTFELWGALLNGGCLVIIPREVALSPAGLIDELDRQAVDHCFLTTAIFNQMVQASDEAFAGLRTMLFGGERCDPQMVRRGLCGGPRNLLHVYGPTECTTFATWYPIENVPESALSIPIGRPIANTAICVVDRYGRTLPAGVPGELWLGGDGLARGYLNRPALTAEKFVPAPDGQRWYRTGDLVRRLPDGNVDFLGRIDQQVKIRGQRIELGEIEAALGTHQEVDETVVLAREDVPGDRRLAAYVVPVNGAEVAPEAAELRDFLRDSLPAYMVPNDWVFLAELPLTPNGKVDRRALPVPEARGVAESVFVPPSTPLEKLLAGIWSEILDVAEAGLRDSFFTLGGHSLLATQVTSRLQDELGFEFPLSLLFDTSNLGELVAHVEARLREDEHGRELLEFLAGLDEVSEEEAELLLADSDVTKERES